MEHIGSLMATMGIDITQAEKNIAKIEKDVKEYAKTVKTEFTKIEKEFTQSGSVFKKYTDTVDKEINGVKKNLVALEKQYKTLATSSISNLGKIDDKVKNHGNVLNATLKTVRAAVLGYVTVLATTKIVDFTKGIITAGVELDSFERSLVAITKSQKQATYEFNFVNKVAKDYGLNLQALRQSYLGLLASTQETNLAGEETRRLFIVTSAAASVLGKSTEDAQGMMRAFIQMISKGTVQAEELRGQLGDRLYGAFNKAAKAMGYSTEELNKNLKKGDVLAEDLIPKLVRLLEGDFLEAAKKAGDGPRASFEKLNTSILNIQEAIANSGVLDSFVDLARETSEWVNTNKKLLAQDFGPFFEAIAFGGKVALAVVGGLANKFSQLAKIGGFAAELIEGSTDAIEVTKTRITELQQRLMEVYSGYNFVSKETQKQRDIEIAQIKQQIKVYEEVLTKFENKAINLKIDTNLEEEFGEIDHLFNELVVKSKLAQDKLRDNTDKLLKKEKAATRKALDEIIKDRKKAYEDLLKLQKKYSDDISEYLATYNLSDYEKKLYYLEKEVQAFKEAGLQEVDYAAYVSAKKQVILKEENERQQKIIDDQIKKQQEAYDDLYDTVYDFTRDVIDDFDNMGDTLVDLAKSIVKDIAAAFLAQNIVMPITMAVGSSFGLTGSGGVPYSAMAGGNGYGSIFGGMPSGNTLSWIGENVPGMGFMSSAMGSIVPGSTMGGAIQAGTGLSSGVTWGTALGAGAISGLGYSMLGGALGLPQSEYSGLTAGLGGAAMSAYGGSLASMTGIGMLGGPIGIGIGALLGGLAGGLFGGSEPEPRIGIRKGDISDFGYNPTTKDMSNQKPINEYIVKYFDSYFSVIDELTSNSVKDVLENTKWERIRVHPDDFDSVEDAIFAVSSDVFEKFADGFISGLADGQLAGYVDENFFGSIKTENENLLDSFIRFGIVIENTDDFVFQFARQIDDFGTSTVQAFNNVSAITAIMGQVEVGIDSIANVSAITTLDNLTASWNDLILSLEAANATTEQLARTQTGMAKALGANLTGLTADTLQAALMSGGDIDSILTSSIQSASYTSIAQDIAETYINNLNEEIGRVWIDSGGNINDVISAMQSLDTTDVRNEIEQLKLSFGLLTDDIEEVSDVIPEVASITDSAEQELNAAQNALNKARDQYADAINYQIGLFNDEIDQIQDEIYLKKELIRENENLLDSFKYLKDHLSEFQTELVLSGSEDPEYQLAYAKSMLDATVQKLYSSNQDDVAEALADLPEVSRQYLDVSKKTNVNELDQLQALGYVQEILNTSQDIASVQVGRTEDTLYELYKQNTILIQNQSYYERQIESLAAIKEEISGTNDLLNLSLEQAKQNYDDAVSNLEDATNNYNNGAASTGVDDDTLRRYETLVREMFWNVFGKSGKDSERSYWVDALVDQTDYITLTNFRDTFISHAKYSERVEQAMKEAFKRKATQEEVLYWSNWANAQSGFVGLYDIEQAMRAYGEDIPAMASGGTVTAPTLALIGEGGQPEHVIPDSQMQGVKDRLDKVCELLFMMTNLNGDNKELLDDLLDVFERNTQGQLPFKTEAA